MTGGSSRHEAAHRISLAAAVLRARHVQAIYCGWARMCLFAHGILGMAICGDFARSILVDRYLLQECCM
jgi:hypothetical protein